jgi:hypothetical protein
VWGKGNLPAKNVIKITKLMQTISLIFEIFRKNHQIVISISKYVENVIGFTYYVDIKIIFSMTR